MTTCRWILLGAAFFFMVSFCLIFLKTIIRKGKKDYAAGKGKISSGVIYSFTGAMSPIKKESAYLHLPTYAAGMIFHLGTFFGFFWLVILFFNVIIWPWFHWISALVLVVTGIMGFSILIKRIVFHKLRSMSNPDDYFSNLLVTGFQFFVAAALIWNRAANPLFIYSACLLLYIPVGKLKHVVYFFTSRIFLGKFYGKRGVWPAEK